MNLTARLFVFYGILPSIAGVAIGVSTQRLSRKVRRIIDGSLWALLAVAIASTLSTFGSPWQMVLPLLGILGIGLLTLLLVRNLCVGAPR